MSSSLSATALPASFSAPPLASSSAAPRTREHPIEIKTRIELVKMAYRELRGGTLASTGLFPTFAGDSPLGIAHVLILAGLITGSARLLLPMRKGSLAYLFTVVVPLGLRFFANGDLAGVTLGVCITIFVAYMAAATR